MISCHWQAINFFRWFLLLFGLPIAKRCRLRYRRCNFRMLLSCNQVDGFVVPFLTHHPDCKAHSFRLTHYFVLSFSRYYHRWGRRKTSKHRNFKFYDFLFAKSQEVWLQFQLRLSLHLWQSSSASRRFRCNGLTFYCISSAAYTRTLGYAKFLCVLFATH